MCKNCKELRQRGFKGFYTFKELRHGKIVEVPNTSGVYIVINHIFEKDPIFLAVGSGGYFKGQNPNKNINVLEEKWRGLKNTKILYVGKGKSLKHRIVKYEKFGQGYRVAHWGGRYTWQLENSEQLIVTWKTVKENPRQEEKKLLNEFETKYTRLPFANLSH